jgi:hypothetical protein
VRYVPCELRLVATKFRRQQACSEVQITAPNPHGSQGGSCRYRESSWYLQDLGKTHSRRVAPVRLAVRTMPAYTENLVGTPPVVGTQGLGIQKAILESVHVG